MSYSRHQAEVPLEPPVLSHPNCAPIPVPTWHCLPSQRLTAEYITILRGSPKCCTREKLARMASSRIPDRTRQSAKNFPEEGASASQPPISTPHPQTSGPSLLPRVGPRVPQYPKPRSELVSAGHPGRPRMGGGDRGLAGEREGGDKVTATS